MRGFVDSLRASSNSLYSRVGTLRSDEPEDDDDCPDLLGLQEDRSKDDSFGEFKGASLGPSHDVWQLLSEGGQQQQAEQPGSNHSTSTTGAAQQQRQHAETPSAATPDLLGLHDSPARVGTLGLLAAAYHGVQQDDDDPFGLGLSNSVAGSSSRAVTTDRVSDDRAASVAAAGPRNNSRSPSLLDDELKVPQRQSNGASRPESESRQQPLRGGGAFSSAFNRFETFPALPGSDDHNSNDSDDEDGFLAGEHRHSGRVASSSRPSSSSSSARVWAQGGEDGLGWDADYETVPIYVVPLFGADSMVVVPAPKRPPPKEQHDLVRGIVSHGKKVQKKVAGAWDSLKDSDPDSLKGKVYRTGQAQLEALSPQERLLGGIPEYAKQLQVVHAPCVNPQQVLNYMARTLKDLAHVQRYKQIGTAALLPVTAVVDAVVIPGPGIMTGLTGYHLYHASKAVSGAQRLKKFLDVYGGVRGQQKGLLATLAGVFEGTGGGGGSSKADEEELDDNALQFMVDERMSRFYARELRDDHGLMPEEEIDALVQELDAPASLADVLHQLRRRELRAKEKKAAAMQSGSSIFALH